MKSEEVLHELEELFELERSISSDEVFSIVDELENSTLKRNIFTKLVSRGVASSSHQAKSWMLLTAKTSIEIAVKEIQRYHAKEGEK